MKIGALIVTTGLPRVSGVTALLPEVGTISAGQRMISVFRCVQAGTVGLVVGPEDKKTERQFSQNGVIFLRCGADTSFREGIREGLRYMAPRFDRVFIVPGDMGLFLPDTLRALLSSNAPAVIPLDGGSRGWPVLLDRQAAEAVLKAPDAASVEEAVKKASLETELVRVEDPGILLRGEELSGRKDLIGLHNSRMSRPVADIAICNGSLLYDFRLGMLLHLVEDTHSVQNACSLMQISYSSAWKMLNHVEDELGFPLVVRNRGGAGGTGTVLTEKGRRLMEAYDGFSGHLNREAQLLYSQIFQPEEHNEHP